MTYDLNELQALLAKMTAGRWSVAGKTTGCISCEGDPKTVGYVHVATVGAYTDKELLRFSRDRWDADAAGIVALRNAAPALIADHLALQARVAELEAEAARLREALAVIAGPKLVKVYGNVAVLRDYARAAIGDQP